jgi:preprotein translocase subunit Sss1
MKTKTTFSQLYNFPGFRARARFKSGIFQDSHARVVSLVRRKKKQFVQGVNIPGKVSTIIGFIGFVIWPPAILESIWNSNTGVWIAGSAKP